MTAKFIVVYSTNNNKPWQAANWRTATETDGLEQAKNAFYNYVALAEQKANSYQCRDNQPPILQVAIFYLRGKDTFAATPRYYADYRDKSDWPMPAATAGLVNTMNSDYSLNIKR